jgi:hypothetical protein
MTLVDTADGDLQKRPWTVGLLLVLFTAPALAAVITPVPGNFVLDGDIGEWKGIPPTLRASAEHDALWYGTSRNGLVLAGLVRDSRWKFARNTAELVNDRRLEIWLTAVEPFELPTIKYDDEACTNEARGVEEVEKACLQWVQKQTEFRELLQRQFTRMWRVAPAAVDEAYALPAYDLLTEPQRVALRFSRPAGLPLSKFHTNADGSLTFEILIPWEIFPPANRLSLDGLRLAVNNKSYLMGAPPAGEDVRDSLPVHQLSPPITTHITTCGQPLLGRNLHGDDEPAFYFLSHSLGIDKVFFFENPEGPYDPPLPEKSDISPRASYQIFFTQELAKGEFLCGPFMSYRMGQIVRKFPFRLAPEQDQVSWAPLGRLPVRRLSDGTRLIRYGPEQSSGPLVAQGILSLLDEDLRSHTIVAGLRSAEPGCLV